MWAACGLKVTCVKATYSQTPLGALEFRQEGLSQFTIYIEDGNK